MNTLPLEHVIFLTGVFGGSFAGLLALRILALKLIKSWSHRRPNGPGAIVYQCIRFPSLFWIVAAAAGIAISVSSFSDKASARLSIASQVLVIFSVTWASANLVVGFTQRALRRIQSPMGESGLIFGLIRTVIFTIGILIIFDELKIAITPILTAMGVAGLAVALALKDTLENLFSGVHLLIEKAVTVGDTVKVESGQVGVIQDIGWRTTKIRISDSEMLIIPNVKFAQGSILRVKAR